MTYIPMCYCQRHDIHPGTYRSIVNSWALRIAQREIDTYPDDQVFDRIHSNMNQWTEQIAQETKADHHSIIRTLERELLGREC